MTNQTSDNNKRIAKNTTFLYIRMFIALIINLYTSRLLLNALGVEDYGIYNVVAGFVSLFGFLNATLSSSVQRFYNFEGVKNGSVGFRNVYMTSLLTHSIIAAIILILLESVGLWYINEIMVLPSNRLFVANILFQLSSFSMVLMTIQIPFVGAVMAKERMDFFAIVSIIDVTLKLLIAILVSWVTCDNLALYGILLFGVSIIDLTLYIVFCKNKFKEMKFCRVFDKRIFLLMMSFSGWNLIGTFAFMLKGQGINMLLNVFFGPVVNAARGIAYQVNGAVSNFTSSVFVAFGPQVVKSYAEGNTLRTKKIMFTESKICFSLIAIILVPVALEIDSLLHLWLGASVPEHTDIFSILVLLDSLICTLNTPCTQVAQATGRIKYYQISSSIVNLLLLPVAGVFLLLGFSAESAFIITIIISGVNQIICVYFANRLMRFGLLDYFSQIILRCFALIVLLPILPMAIHILLPVGFFKVIIVSVSSLLSGIILIYEIVLCKEERLLLNDFIKVKIKKYAKG